MNWKRLQIELQTGLQESVAMVLCLLSRDSHGDTTKLNHEETVRGPEIAICNFCNFAILQFAINTSKPPAPVALEGRLCRSAKPHEYKRSLVWLNLPPLAKLGIPRAGVATALKLQSPAVTGAPLHPTSPPPKISSLSKKTKKNF